MINAIPASKYCHRIFDGTHETPKPVNFGRHLVTSKNIKGGVLDRSTCYFISEEDYHGIQTRSYVSQWDVMFSMIGSVGDVYLEKNREIDYAVKNVGVFSCLDEDKAKWLYYFFRTKTAQSIIRNQLNGAVQKFLPLGALRNFPIPSFDPDKKNGIKLLSALDAKIELNNQINAELEAMAKLLYDYWFVQFDFPMTAAQAASLGRPALEGKPYRSSGGKMVHNPTLNRPIPRDWSESTIGDTFKTDLGGTPSKKVPEYWLPAEINWLSSGEKDNSFVLSSADHISELGLKNSAAKLLPKGTVILSIVRHLRASILGIPAATNQSVVGIQETAKIKSCYIYPYIVREIPRLMTLRTGAQQPHINKGVLDDSPLAIPDSDVLAAYTRLSTPLFEQMENLQKQNQELTQLRDWLLPMLMNGQVTVSA